MEEEIIDVTYRIDLLEIVTLIVYIMVPTIVGWYSMKWMRRLWRRTIR